MRIRIDKGLILGYIVLDNPVAMGGNTMPIRIPSGNITSTQMPIENEIGYIVGFSDDNYCNYKHIFNYI